jgi:hypothetical protein
MATGKPALSKELKYKLLDHGYTLAEAARSLNLSHNSVRAWMSRSIFPVHELELLAGLAGLPTDVNELSENYQFNLVQHPKRSRRREREEFERVPPTDLGRALLHMDSRLGEYERLREDFGQDMHVLFSALGTADVYVHCALDQVAYEIDEVGWSAIGMDVARAIERGSYFVYLYPDEAVTKAMRDSGLRRLSDPAEFEKIFDLFVDRLTRTLGGTDLKRVRAHVHAIKCASSAFMVTGHQFFLFRPRSTAYPTRSTGRFPTGTKDSASFLHLPLPEEISNQFVNVIRQALTGTDRSELLKLFV